MSQMSQDTVTQPSRAPRPVLLTVDDDPSVSRAVARDLRRRYGEDYRIVRAESGADALDALKEILRRGERVAAILADYRMPHMNGIDFLEQAMDLFPNARRALLTAYADTDAAIQAINVVDVDQYLLKPWEPPEEKLYPVVDELITTWQSTGDQAVTETKVIGHHWSQPSYEIRDFLARSSVPYRWYAADEPAGQRLLTRRRRRRVRRAGRHRPRRHGAAQPLDRRARGGHRADHHAVGRVLRPGHRRRRPGRAGRRGLRRVRGPAHPAGRPDGDGRAGRAEQPDRELPGLPRRRLGRPADRPGSPAGREVRRRGALDPRRSPASRPAARAASCSSPTAARSPRTPSSWPAASTTGSCPPTARTGWSGRGVYYGSASTEGPACAGQHVVVVGGANSAGQAAMFFARHAARVTHRGPRAGPRALDVDAT